MQRFPSLLQNKVAYHPGSIWSQDRSEPTSAGDNLGHSSLMFQGYRHCCGQRLEKRNALIVAAIAFSY